jgi:molecular chaperone DnaK
MIREAEVHADEAHHLRELADTRNAAETLAYQTEKSLQEHRDSLDPGLASTVEGRVMELRAVLETADVAELKEKTDTLQAAWTEAAQAMYANASAAGAGAPQADGAAHEESDDEVVEDAEYEVVDE